MVKDTQINAWVSHDSVVKGIPLRLNDYYAEFKLIYTYIFSPFKKFSINIDFKAKDCFITKNPSN